MSSVRLSGQSVSESGSGSTLTSSVPKIDTEYMCTRLLKVVCFPSTASEYTRTRFFNSKCRGLSRFGLYLLLVYLVTEVSSHHTSVISFPEPTTKRQFHGITYYVIYSEQSRSCIWMTHHSLTNQSTKLAVDDKELYKKTPKGSDKAGERISEALVCVSCADYFNSSHIMPKWIVTVVTKIFLFI